jgi:hypothetical protein
MAQAPDITAKGYQPPQVTQFSIFLDNRVGKLAKLLQIFEGHPLRIVALSIADSSDFSVVRIVTTRAGLARQLLDEQKLPYSETEILVVELEANQTLRQVCLHLLALEVNIRYAYALLARPQGGPTIAIHTDDQVLAGQLLRRKLFTLLGEEDLTNHIGDADPLDPSSN